MIFRKALFPQSFENLLRFTLSIHFFHLYLSFYFRYSDRFDRYEKCKIKHGNECVFETQTNILRHAYFFQQAYGILGYYIFFFFLKEYYT